MREVIALALVVIGVILMVVAQVTGIGVFLYDWGVNNVALGLAAWTGFVLWAKLLIGGFITYAVGAFLL